MDMTSSMMRKALATGASDAVRALTMRRSEGMRAKRRRTRTARRRRREERPGVEARATVRRDAETTMKSKTGERAREEGRESE
jgi:hypothetical protein